MLRSIGKQSGESVEPVLKQSFKRVSPYSTKRCPVVAAAPISLAALLGLCRQSPFGSVASTN